MSELQWALLVLAVTAVISIYWFSRARPERSQRQAPDAVPETQLDLWNSAEPSAEKFDEFGVGVPRTRGGPPVADEDPVEPAPEPVAAPERVPVAQASIEEKIISFYIAEREGTYIFGPQIHAALQQQGLSYGSRKIYHRLHQGQTVFAIASMLKPGELDPQQSDSFSTPGLSVFMVLPCAQKPMAAFDDMLGTAQALARSLNAQLYDDQRQLLDSQRAERLREDVAQWVQQAAPEPA